MIKLGLYLLTVLSSCYANLESRCTTPDGGSGICKNIKDCPRLLNSLNDLNYVISHYCGEDKGFCCSDCYTPDGASGVCVVMSECPQLSKLLYTPQINYVRNSICPSGRHVCCGPPPEPIIRGKCHNRVTAFPPDPTTECCGRDSILDSKIYGGNATRIDEYPWLVILEYKFGRKTVLDCGGALISGKYVLTAAHCVNGRIGEMLKSIRLGEYDTDNEGNDCDSTNLDCTDPAVSIPIEEIIIHPEYDTKTKSNDIALIRLSQMANYTDFIRPICLPPTDIVQSMPLSMLDVYVAGWGRVNSYVQRSAKKQHVRLPMVNMEICNRRYMRSGFNLWRKQLCAGGEVGKDSCKGDSGGPLMLDVPSSVAGKKYYEAIGIISFGPISCGTKGMPGVYTKVYEYNTWIRFNIRP